MGISFVKNNMWFYTFTSLFIYLFIWSRLPLFNRNGRPNVMYTCLLSTLSSLAELILELSTLGPTESISESIYTIQATFRTVLCLLLTGFSVAVKDVPVTDSDLESSPLLREQTKGLPTIVLRTL